MQHLKFQNGEIKAFIDIDGDTITISHGEVYLDYNSYLHNGSIQITKLLIAAFPNIDFNRFNYNLEYLVFKEYVNLENE